MWRTIRRASVFVLGGAFTLATVALAPGHPAGWQVVDQALVSELAAADTAAFLGSHYGLAPEALDPNPAVVAQWWSSVPRLQQTRLVLRMPEVIGNLAGVDYASRDRANRTQLERDLHAAEQAAHPGDEAAALQIAALRAITGALDAGDGPPRFLIQLTGDQPPLAAIAVGDPDTADQITFAVPGMGTLTTDAQLWTRAAQNLYDAQTEAGASVRHSVVAWMGYRTPPVGMDATRDPHADRGATLLSHDILGLRAARQTGTQPSVSVVAHSYGSTTAAKALAETDLGIHSFVLLGSAGVDSDITSADDLHAQHVYAGEAAADHQARWGRIDRLDPGDRAFGATPLGVDGNHARGLLPVTGHDPIIHSPWNDDPASPVWNRYADTDARERMYQRHMASFGYLDAGTQSIANVATVTTAPLRRALASGPQFRVRGTMIVNDERGPAVAEPLSDLRVD